MQHDEMISELQKIAGTASRGWQKRAAEAACISLATLNLALRQPHKPVPAPIIAAINAHRAGRRGAGQGAAFGPVDWSTLGKWSIVIPSQFCGDADVTDIGVMCHASPRFVLFAQARAGERAGRVRYERLSGTREPDSSTIAEGLALLERELQQTVVARVEAEQMRRMKRNAKKKHALSRGKDGDREWSEMTPSDRIEAARSYDKSDVDRVRDELRSRRVAADERLRAAVASGDVREVEESAIEVGRLMSEQHIIASAAIAHQIDESDAAVRLLIKSTLAQIVSDDARKDGTGARSRGWSGDDPEAERARGEAAWQSMIDEIKREARARATEIGSVASAARDLSKLPGLRQAAVATLTKLDEGMDELVYEKSRDEIAAAGGADEIVEKWRKDIGGKIDYALKTAGR